MKNNTKQIKIRDARPEDVNTISNLSKQINDVARRRKPAWLSKQDLSKPPKFYADIIKHNNNKKLVVAETDDGRILGYVMATIERQPDDLISVPYVSIDEIVVDKMYRRRGIGESLIKEIHNWGKSKKIQVIQLSVWEFNKKAIQFFQKLGYKTLMRKMENIIGVKNRARKK